mmetsp:Transcript_15088/g.38804  ORF Transcript_15088/g.38804 Transcript_15088/m.38804 type:complete len:220 (-) Transcript_15088:76-735(-)
MGRPIAQSGRASRAGPYGVARRRFFPSRAGPALLARQRDVRHSCGISRPWCLQPGSLRPLLAFGVAGVRHPCARRHPSCYPADIPARRALICRVFTTASDVWRRRSFRLKLLATLSRATCHWSATRAPRGGNVGEGAESHLLARVVATLRSLREPGVPRSPARSAPRRFRCVARAVLVVRQVERPQLAHKRWTGSVETAAARVAGPRIRRCVVCSQTPA